MAHTCTSSCSALLSEWRFLKRFLCMCMCMCVTSKEGQTKIEQKMSGKAWVNFYICIVQWQLRFKFTLKSYTHLWDNKIWNEDQEDATIIIAFSGPDPCKTFTFDHYVRSLLDEGRGEQAQSPDRRQSVDYTPLNSVFEFYIEQPFVYT